MIGLLPAVAASPNLVGTISAPFLLHFGIHLPACDFSSAMSVIFGYVQARSAAYREPPKPCVTKSIDGLDYITGCSISWKSVTRLRKSRCRQAVLDLQQRALHVGERRPQPMLQNAGENQLGEIMRVIPEIFAAYPLYR